MNKIKFINNMFNTIKYIYNGSYFKCRESRKETSVDQTFIVKLMQKRNYIGDFEVVDDRRGGKVVIELLGRINKCGVISPRFDIGVTEYEKVVANLLPSRQFGYIVMTTNIGIIDQEKARRRHVGGKILGFFY